MHLSSDCEQLFKKLKMAPLSGGGIAVKFTVFTFQSLLLQVLMHPRAYDT